MKSTGYRGLNHIKRKDCSRDDPLPNKVNQHIG